MKIKNLYFVGGGLGMIALAVVIGLLICKKAENRKGKGLLEGNDSDWLIISSNNCIFI